MEGRGVWLLRGMSVPPATTHPPRIRPTLLARRQLVARIGVRRRRWGARIRPPHTSGGRVMVVHTLAVNRCPGGADRGWRRRRVTGSSGHYRWFKPCPPGHQSNARGRARAAAGDGRRRMRKDRAGAGGAGGGAGHGGGSHRTRVPRRPCRWGRVGRSPQRMLKISWEILLWCGRLGRRVSGAARPPGPLRGLLSASTGGGCWESGAVGLGRGGSARGSRVGGPGRPSGPPCGRDQAWCGGSGGVSGAGGRIRGGWGASERRRRLLAALAGVGGDQGEARTGPIRPWRGLSARPGRFSGRAGSGDFGGFGRGRCRGGVRGFP